MRNFHSLDGALEGQGGDAIRGFYKNTHEPFLIYLHQSLTDYKQALEATSEAIHSFESHSDGYVSQDFLLNDVMDGYDQVGDKAKAFADEANQILNSVQDIVYIKPIDETEMMNSVSKGKEQVDTISEEFIEVDKEGASRLEETQDDLKTMQTFLSEMSTKFDSSASISSYSVASTREMSALHTMKDEVYNKDKATISAANNLDENSSMYELEKAKESEITDLDNGGKDILIRAFSDLEEGKISKEEYLNIRNGTKEFDQVLKTGKDVDVSTEFTDYVHHIYGERMNKTSDVTGEVVKYGSPLNGVFAAYGLEKKGFKIERYETKGKQMIRYRVHNPEVSGIRPPKNKNRKTKLYDRNHMKQKGVKTPIQQHVKPGSGAINGLKTKAGWFGIALETGLNVKDNIRDGESTSKIIGDAGVDVGIGAVSLLAAGAASAIAVGTFGAPLIGGAIVAAGLSYGIMGIMSIKAGDKTLTGHVKSGVQSIAGWFSKYRCEKII